MSADRLDGIYQAGAWMLFTKELAVHAIPSAARVDTGIDEGINLTKLTEEKLCSGLDHSWERDNAR
jgi:hypothetical protein